MIRMIVVISTTVVFTLLGLLVAYLTVDAIDSLKSDEVMLIFALYPLGGFAVGIVTSIIAIKVGSRSDK